MKDRTENLRRNLIASGVPARELADATEKWDTDQVRELFEVHSFLAPFVFATRKKDGVKGVMMFTHNPRWYFNFIPEDAL